MTPMPKGLKASVVLQAHHDRQRARPFSGAMCADGSFALEGRNGAIAGGVSARECRSLSDPRNCLLGRLWARKRRGGSWGGATAFSRFPRVHGPDLEGQQRSMAVDRDRLKWADSGP